MVITFDRADHPPKLHRRGKYALIVNPLIDGYGFSKTLMDGGSSINILYVEMLHRMKISETQMNHSSVIFHGVVPGRQANSLGEITLDVTFGTPKNYRTEALSFEVVPFKSAYHAIFGRPAYWAFMARPCYIYNMMKILGPNGVITIKGDPKKARECEDGNAAFAEAVLHAQEYQEIKKSIDPSEMPATKKEVTKPNPEFKASEETKKTSLKDDDPSKVTQIGVGLGSA